MTAPQKNFFTALSNCKGFTQENANLIKDVINRFFGKHLKNLSKDDAMEIEGTKSISLLVNEYQDEKSLTAKDEEFPIDYLQKLDLLLKIIPLLKSLDKNSDSLIFSGILLSLHSKKTECQNSALEALKVFKIKDFSSSIKKLKTLQKVTFIPYSKKESFYESLMSNLKSYEESEVSIELRPGNIRNRVAYHNLPSDVNQDSKQSSKPKGSQQK